MPSAPAAKRPNPPRKHHFAPEFYLKRWAGADGALEQFSRPGGRTVKALRKHPGATGFATDLYTMPGLPEHLVQQVEQRFFQEVDTRAAELLAALEGGELRAWTPETRSAWTRFIQSLHLRTPDDVLGIKARTSNDWARISPEIQQQYEALKRPGDPPTAEEYWTRNDPDLVERIGVAMMTRLIGNSRLGAKINNMAWAVLDLSGSNLDLMTSDRTVERPFGLADPRAYISVPLGPKALFIAANEAGTIDALRRASPRELVRNRNHFTVRGAAEFVWARDRSQECFVETNFGTHTVSALGALLAEKIGGETPGRLASA